MRWRVRRSYSLHASPIRKRIREAYQCNPSLTRKRAHLAYPNNSSPVKKRVLRKYHEDSSPFKEHAKVLYHSAITTSRLLQRKQYAKDRSYGRKRSQHSFYKHEDEVLEKALHHRHTTLAAINVRSKYDRMFNRKFGQYSTFNDFVKKLTTKMGMHNQATNQLKAQMLVRSCLQQLSLCKH